MANSMRYWYSNVFLESYNGHEFQLITVFPKYKTPMLLGLGRNADLVYGGKKVTQTGNVGW